MPTKITHLPYNQGNLITALQYAEREMGAESTSIAWRNPFVDSPNILLPKNYRRRVRTLKLYRNIRRSDILAFNFGSSFFDTPSRHKFLLDLPYYPRTQKRMMFYQGSDARICYRECILESREYERSLGHDIQDVTNDGFISKEEISLKRKRVGKADKYVHRMFYLNPDLSVGLPERAIFLPYPYPHRNKPISKKIELRHPLRVLHLSTNRVLKGTGLIERALKEAKKSLPIDVKVCVRVPRLEAMQALKWADIFIDQVGIGWYGMQAVEALSLGKIVICSIDHNHWAKHMPDYNNKLSGIINSTHRDIPDVLARLSDSPELRRSLSIAAQNFVKEVHDPIKVVRGSYGDWIE